MATPPPTATAAASRPPIPRSEVEPMGPPATRSGKKRTLAKVSAAAGARRLRRSFESMGEPYSKTAVLAGDCALRRLTGRRGSVYSAVSAFDPWTRPPGLETGWPVKIPIYMDYHATTPVDPRALAAMLPYFTEKFGNPHSRNHEYGWEAEEAVEVARAQVAEAVAE